MALIAGSWLIVDAALKQRIAHDLRHTLRAEVALWVPTAEQVTQIEETLSLSYDKWRQYWLGEGYAVASIDEWDMREHWQYQLMMCHLGRYKFLREDPQASDWPESFCEAVEEYISGDPTPISDITGNPLIRTETDQLSRKQPKWTNRNGLLGTNHDRRWDADAATTTRSGELPPFSPNDSILRN